jgi:hypothetical protein
MPDGECPPAMRLGNARQSIRVTNGLPVQVEVECVSQ